MPTSQYDEKIRKAAEKFLPGWDWRLLKAQFMAESQLNPDAVSHAGAKGIAQFMPETWMEVAEELNFPSQATPHSADLSIIAGAYYMSKMLNGWTAERLPMDKYCLAMASYNAGLGNLYKAQKRANDANDYASIIRALQQITGNRNAGETTSYVRRILNYYNGLVTG